MVKENTKAYGVILAGGRGERFWPMSRMARPKQFIDMFGGRPLLRIAVDRLEGLLPPERVIIITSSDLVEATRAAAPGLPPENVVGEPMGRDTAAACALATELVAARDPGAALAILTADHLIGREDVFRRTLADSFELALETGSIVTIGITPDHPATGFGYIEAGGELDFPGDTAFRHVRRFVEKPDAETAAGYLAGGKHLWNSGMFVWSVGTFRAALREFRPALADAMRELSPSIGGADFDTVLARVYEGLERISVDYAIMEHARNIAMAGGSFGWDDVGSWAAAAGHFDADADGNAFLGEVEAVGTKGSFAVSSDGHLVALYGVEDLVVVHTPQITMVCPRDRAQELKELVTAVGKRPGGERYL